MTEHRPRSFAWVQGLKGPEPQVIFEDPRTGCESTPFIVQHPLPPGDTRSLTQLARDYPAPKEAV